MSKYSTPLPNGDKHYVVDYNDFRTSRQAIVTARNTSVARYRAIGRSRPGVYVTSVRRALSTEVPTATGGEQ